MTRPLALGALVLLCAGCPKRAPVGVDNELPEHVEAVEAQAPREILVAGAEHGEPSHRGHALGFLIATSPEPGGGEWAARALYDPDGWVQRQGVVALVGRLEEPEAQEHLIAYLSRASADPYSRGYAGVRMRGLELEPAARVRDALREAWRAEGQRWRQAPLALAALLHGDDDASEPLKGALSRGDLALEMDFVRDVGLSGRSELLPALQEGSDWVEEELSLVYAVARLSLGDGSAEQVLRKALGGSDAAVQLEALDHLASLDGPEAEALLRRASGQGSDLIRRTASLALAARGVEPTATIVRAASDPDDEIRALAVRFAGERLAHTPSLPRKDARALEEVLQAGLVDSDPEVRRGAVEGVAAARLPDRPRLLAPALVDDAYDTRLQAAGAVLAAQRDGATGRPRPPPSPR